MESQNYGGARPKIGERIVRSRSGSPSPDRSLDGQRQTSSGRALRLRDSNIPARDLRPGVPADVSKEMDEIIAGHQAEQSSAGRAATRRVTVPNQEQRDVVIRRMLGLPPLSAPMPSRRSTMRDCDHCHKTYLASVDGNLYIEDLEPGAPERICNDCKSKLPATLVGTATESQPDDLEQAMSSFLTLWRSRRSANDDDDDDDDPATRYYSLRLSRIPLYHRSSKDLSLLKHESLGYIPGVKRFEDRRLPPIEDCYIDPSDRYNIYTKPCDKHPQPDPQCWVGKPFDSIPEACHQRYWQNYMKDRDIGRLRYNLKTGAPLKAKRRMSRTIYQPKRWLKPGSELTNISEDEVWDLVTADYPFEDDDETF